MTPQELAQFLAQNATVERPKRRAIKSRHYDIIVKRDGIQIEKVEYLTLRQARELRTEWRKDGAIVEIEESVTVLPNGKELEFTGHIDIPEKKGVGGFGTPTATERKIENDREKARRKGIKRNADKSKSIRVIGYTMADPKSPLHQEYMQYVNKNGFEVRFKGSDKVIFWGTEKELIDWLKSGSVRSINQVKEELDIRFMGRERPAKVEMPFVRKM